MAPAEQLKLFELDPQPTPLAKHPAPPKRRDPHEVRGRLKKILAEARAAEKVPWDPVMLSLYRHIFPLTTQWLPDDEAARLRFEFEAELTRLEAT